MRTPCTPPARRRREAWRRAAMTVFDRTPVGRQACRQGFVLTHPQIRDGGMSDADIRRMVRHRQWTVPHRGVVCVLPPPVEQWQREPHGLRPEIRASAVALSRPDTVISHECGALAHGLDVLHTPKIGTLSTRWRSHALARPDVVVRAAGYTDDDVATWFGAKIMSVPRTVVDLARQGIADGLVTADSALFNEMLTHDELAAALAKAARWHGVVGARRLLELASALSESPLESMTRLFLDDRGIPLPEQQQWIQTHLGWFRVDGVWQAERVILECDGLVKYQRTDDDEGDPLSKEKVRQEALERAGYRVVRVLWSDLRNDPEGTAARIRATLRWRREPSNLQVATTGFRPDSW